MKTIAAVPLLALGSHRLCSPIIPSPAIRPIRKGRRAIRSPIRPTPARAIRRGPPMPPGGPSIRDRASRPIRSRAIRPARPTYRAIGTEPFWDLEIGRDLIFTDRGNNVSVSQPTPQPINGTAGEIYRTQRLEVNIVHRQCSDGMSDRTYPDTVDVYVDGRQYRGCGAPIAFFSQVGETGQPNYPARGELPAQPYRAPIIRAGSTGRQLSGTGSTGAMMLSGTNWRVVAINGTPDARRAISTSTSCPTGSAPSSAATRWARATARPAPR